MSWLLPEASSNAAEVDALLLCLVVVMVLVLAMVFGLIWLYAIRYRAGNPAPRGKPSEKTWAFEIAWTSATLVLFFALFVWGANLYVRQAAPPRDTMKIWVVGKQWMWKAEHPGGQREINALHVPTGVPIQLIMTSEDVIHDFSIPAFRIKHDVLPGRYETLWFRADLPGSYHLFCTQFCGTDHSLMEGTVTVQSPPDYARWLASAAGGETLALQGRALFTSYGCAGCHAGQGSVHAPRLEGVYGGPVNLLDGSVVVADDQYLRDSILTPQKHLVAGYPNAMPAFAGVIGEEDLVRIIAYLKSVAIADPAPPT